MILLLTGVEGHPKEKLAQRFVHHGAAVTEDFGLWVVNTFGQDTKVRAGNGYFFVRDAGGCECYMQYRR